VFRLLGASQHGRPVLPSRLFWQVLDRPDVSNVDSRVVWGHVRPHACSRLRATLAELPQPLSMPPFSMKLMLLPNYNLRIFPILFLQSLGSGLRLVNKLPPSNWFDSTWFLLQYRQMELVHLYAAKEGTEDKQKM
jgi:hypothetical protein